MALRACRAESRHARARRSLEASGERPVLAVLVILAAYLIGIALLALISPSTFFDRVGPFGVSNPHYTRDGATFELALGVAAAVAVRRISWRVPILATLALQSLLHALNHLADVGKAHPSWLGPFDFVGLALGTVLLAWAAIRARAQEAMR